MDSENRTCMVDSEEEDVDGDLDSMSDASMVGSDEEYSGNLSESNSFISDEDSHSNDSFSSDSSQTSLDSKSNRKYVKQPTPECDKILKEHLRKTRYGKDLIKKEMRSNSPNQMGESDLCDDIKSIPEVAPNNIPEKKETNMTITDPLLVKNEENQIKLEIKEEESYEIKKDIEPCNNKRKIYEDYSFETSKTKRLSNQPLSLDFINKMCSGRFPVVSLTRVNVPIINTPESSSETPEEHRFASSLSYSLTQEERDRALAESIEQKQVNCLDSLFESYLKSTTNSIDIKTEPDLDFGDVVVSPSDNFSDSSFPIPTDDIKSEVKEETVDCDVTENRAAAKRHKKVSR